MQVYQIRMKIYLLAQIDIKEIQEKLTAFLDKSFTVSDALMQMHEENRYKNYCYDLPYPLEKDKIYKKGKVYTVTIRTVDSKLAKHFLEVCVNSYTADIKGLTAQIRILPKKIIESIYTLTPVVLKDERGYWRNYMGMDAFGERIRINLIKKWNGLHDEKLDENFQLYTLLEFLNDSPIPMEYKNIRLLGDKIRLQIADNETAQDLAYMALGTGILEMNARGAGFVNYRWF